MGLMTKGGGDDFLCYNRQDCWHQEIKRTVIDLELHGSRASGTACS